MARLAVVFLACILIAGCGGGVSTFSGSSLSVSELRSAPEQVGVDGFQCKIGPLTSLYRDLRAGSGESGGDPLVVTISITDLEAKPLPAVIPTHVWVIKGDEVWESDLPSTGTAVAGGGPKWPAGSRVDIVVRLVDNAGNSHLVRASDKLVTGMQ